MSSPRLLFALLAAAALLPGCKRKEIRVYIAPKDPPASAKPAEDQPANLPRERRPEVAYQMPSNWSQAAPDAVSIANFVIQTDHGHASVNVTPLADFSGREAIVVNMWRQQIGLPELSPDEAEKALSSIKVGGRDGKIFEVTGMMEGQPRKIVTAMVHRPDATWFYKLAGDEAVVNAEKPAFLAFIQTVRLATEPPAHPETAATTPSEPASGPAASAPTIADHSAAAESGQTASAAADPKPEAAPAGWRTLTPGAMQVAKFAVPDQGSAKAEVSVSVFGSDTGGALPNINRWRGQVGLEPVDETGLAAITKPIPGLDGAILADFSKDNRRMVGAIVPRGGRWWFYKLLGDADAVAAAESTFVAFVQAPPPS